MLVLKVALLELFDLLDVKKVRISVAVIFMQAFLKTLFEVQLLYMFRRYFLIFIKGASFLY